jgi:cardiolipin synthase
MGKRTIERKNSIRSSIGRIFIYALAVIIQWALIVLLISYFGNRYPIVASLIRGAAIVFALYVNSRDNVSTMKMVWIIVLLILPIFGLILYFTFRFNRSKRLMQKKLITVDEDILPLLQKTDTVDRNELDIPELDKSNLQYLNDVCHFPTYKNTKLKYFGNQNDCYDAMLEDIAKAKEYIYMEYHAIEDKESFSRLHQILIDRAKAGVDVRILYDDIGSYVFISKAFIDMLQTEGIKCNVFNTAIPLFTAFVNNRDHRKITVVDGKVAYTGGFNIADEYFNITHPYGMWKDNGIRMEGPSVMSMEAQFIEMWNFADLRYKREEEMEFKPRILEFESCESIVTPYADSPIDEEPVGENVYINIINRSTRYCWFMTPYLVLSDEMKRTLINARKRGVDIRIVTPGIPDKRTIYALTRSYYYPLCQEGIRIYEYTPGFLHSKLCMSDDHSAVVGTINLDFRSFYHHFENAVYILDDECFEDIKTDFEYTFKASQEVTEKYSIEPNIFKSIAKSILRLIAPIA